MHCYPFQVFLQIEIKMKLFPTPLWHTFPFIHLKPKKGEPLLGGANLVPRALFAPPPKPGKSALGTRLGWSLPFKDVIGSTP